MAVSQAGKACTLSPTLLCSLTALLKPTRLYGTIATAQCQARDEAPAVRDRVATDNQFPRRAYGTQQDNTAMVH